MYWRPKRYIPVQSNSHAQFIGFSDSSLKGYATDVFLRLTYVNASTTIHLITAKSKVAPLQSSRVDELLFVPRLDLCGALLLAQVLQRVQGTLASVVTLSSIHTWTDSTFVPEQASHTLGAVTLTTKVDDPEWFNWLSSWQGFRV